MYEGKIGVGIVSFNRPDYLKELLKSLSANDTKKMDFWLFQDGAVNKFNGTRYAQDKDIEKSLQVYREWELAGELIERKDNVGIGINQIKATNQMAENYDYIMMMECDQKVSPYFTRIMRVMADQFLDNNFVFSVSPGHRKLCKEEEYEDYLDRAKVTRGHWWCEMFTKKGWNRIKPYLDQYWPLIKDVAYRDRDHDKIAELWESLGGGGYHTTGQDSAKGVATHAAGMIRIRPVVNRAINIGAKGWNFNKENKLLDSHINREPYIFDIDKKLERFKLMI